MKRIVFYLLLITTVGMSLSCKKETPVSDSLIGTWELSADYGGWSGTHNHQPGNDTLAVFTSATFAFYAKGTLKRSGNYTTKKDTVHMYGTLGTRIIYDDQGANGVHEFFTIQNNKLNFFIDAWDAGGTTYRRIK